MYAQFGGCCRRGGAVYVTVAVALVALVGAVACSVDIGRVILAAQRAQQVADAAALAAVSQPIGDPLSDTLTLIADTVQANNHVSSPPVAWSSGEVVIYQSGETVPGYGVLGGGQEGVTIVTHVEVPYYFARILGLQGTTVTRAATAVRVFAPGTPICPVWVSYETDYQYGQTQELLLDAAPSANLPGNFGFLEPPTGSNDFLELLRGYDLPPEKVIGNYIEVGEIVTGYTGVSTGQWRGALEADVDGLARLQRADWEYWAGDTFENYHPDNPRFLILPMSRYLDGTGTNARFEIMCFGVFWLESVKTTGSKSISGRFVQFQTPGGSTDALAELTGLWTTKLVQ